MLGRRDPSKPAGIRALGRDVNRNANWGNHFLFEVLLASRRASSCACSKDDGEMGLRAGIGVEGSLNKGSGQVEAIKAGRIRKPVVAWVSGTCAKLFKSEVQFGHAGAKSGGQAESAQVV